LKKPFAFILSVSFFLSSIIMPYSNFDDTSSFRSILSDSRQEDEDMNISEFIFEKMLTIGELFEGNEKEEDTPKQHQPIPLQQLQPIQSGSLYCNKAIVAVQYKTLLPAKPGCLFVENKFPFDFHASIFHPPSVIS
jgi:hypothetical protein